MVTSRGGRKKEASAFFFPPLILFVSFETITTGYNGLNALSLSFPNAFDRPPVDFSAPSLTLALVIRGRGGEKKAATIYIGCSSRLLLQE